MIVHHEAARQAYMQLQYHYYYTKIEEALIKGWRPAPQTLVNNKTQLECGSMGCPKLTKGSQPLVGRSSPYCGDI